MTPGRSTLVRIHLDVLVPPVENDDRMISEITGERILSLIYARTPWKYQSLAVTDMGVPAEPDDNQLF